MSRVRENRIHGSMGEALETERTDGAYGDGLSRRYGSPGTTAAGPYGTDPLCHRASALPDGHPTGGSSKPSYSPANRNALFESG